MEVWRAILTELPGARDVTIPSRPEGGAGPYGNHDVGSGGGGDDKGDGGSGLYESTKRMGGGWGAVMLKVAK